MCTYVLNTAIGTASGSRAPSALIEHISGRPRQTGARVDRREQPGRRAVHFARRRSLHLRMLNRPPKMPGKRPDLLASCRRSATLPTTLPTTARVRSPKTG
jgi:hypothetical protein